MRIEKSLENISDGRIYNINDVAKADAGGCENCSACCFNVGDLIELSPYDVWQLKKATHKFFDELVGDKIQLKANNKITLPYLKMREDLGCGFLNKENRCSIHLYRPNICRLFPLGRIYLSDEFKYFLQVDACINPILHEIKISEWINIEEYENNKALIMNWYFLIKALTFRVKFIYDEQELAKVNDYLIDTFYRRDCPENNNYYDFFATLLIEAKDKLGIIL